MTDLNQFISEDDLNIIQPDEKLWLKNIFRRLKGYPNLDQMWMIMDEIWQDLECNPKSTNFQIKKYYSHPVWLLNGLFAEQHQQSLSNRKEFANWVCAQKPNRVADYGGGFGTLARMIGEICPNTEVDIIEPYPHRLAIEKNKRFKNVNYKNSLKGKYDVMIATDIFEHIEDPLAAVFETSKSLTLGGKYLIANCFYPVILCHLPQCFHFRYTWDSVIKKLGLEIERNILYGTVFLYKNNLNLKAARKIELRSKKIWKLTKKLHRYLQQFIARMLV